MVNTINKEVNHREMKMPQKPKEKNTTNNGELFDTLEKNKKERIILEIDGQKVEGEKYYFEYPKYLQKETGILGYTRIIIPEDNFKIFKEYYKDKYEKEEFLMNKLLPSISKGAYPSTTINHVYSWHYDKNDQNHHKAYLKNHNFFLQMLYDITLIKEEKKRKKFPFSNAELAKHDYSKNHANITIYDKNTDEKKSDGKYISLGEIVKYEKEIKENNLYAATTHSGLNMSYGNFFQYNLSLEKIAFGFDLKEPFFAEYLEQSFLHIIKNIDTEEIKTTITKNQTFALMFIWFIINKMDKEDIKINIKDPKAISFKLSVEFKEYIKNQGIANLISFFKKNNLEKEYQKRDILKEENIIKSIEHACFSEFKMPIFIGHPQIPQLSWGHAKYAHFFSEKGFNFFEFKHAEHILKPKEN